MKIKNIDHFVITTADLQACLDFYVGILGLEHRESNGHHNLYFPGGKISIHTSKGEFQPAALNPTIGSQDFCLIVEDDLETVKRELEYKGIKLLMDIVERHGAHGTMRSLYVRDPDGNLVELSSYRFIMGDE
jgi:catechol 2,3-dioxygenase-like lactoylglutathione lyase family enzyme